jgi:hypothetical protein
METPMDHPRAIPGPGKVAELLALTALAFVLMIVLGAAPMSAHDSRLAAGGPPAAAKP